MVVLWGIVVPHIAHASFCDTVDCCRQRSRACVTTPDPFSIIEKSDESQFFENMTNDHLFKNKEDVATVDKTDEVEDQKVFPQFRFEGYVRCTAQLNLLLTP